MSLLGLPLFWGWLGLGLALIGAEMLVAPGSYLLWIGLASLLMAGITWFVPVAGLSELALFGVLALACGLLGWKVYGAKSRDDAASDLHDLSREWIGRTVQLAAPIENGIGQARFGDSVWRVAGADAPAGASVRVTGIDGTTLLVEPL